MKARTRNLIIVGVLASVIVFLGFLTLLIRGGVENAGPPHAGSAGGPLPTGAPPSGPNSIASVDDSLRALDWGHIAFNTSATMKFGEPHPVELLLSPSLSAKDLQGQLQEKAGADAAPVRISNRMEAQLTGQGFEIEAVTPELQAVTSQQVTRWRWEVTPTERGPRKLHVTVSAHIDVAGRDAPLVVRTFDSNIHVNITIPQRIAGFVQKNWQWLWAAIVVPIAGYLLKAWKGRGTKPPASAGRPSPSG